MPVEHELELIFPTAQVSQPIICEMARATDVVFNLHRASVSHRQGRMCLKLIGDADAVRQAEALLAERGVEVTVTTEHRVDAPAGPPSAVPRCAPAPPGEPIIERKLWLTVGGDAIERPVLWEMARRFDLTFDVRQSSIGRDVGIVGLLLRGTTEQVDGACGFLADQGIEVEPIEKSIVEP